jgi:hypothetical protein
MAAINDALRGEMPHRGTTHKPVVFVH